MKTLLSCWLILSSLAFCGSACQETKSCLLCGSSSSCEKPKDDGEPCVLDADCQDWICQDGTCDSLSDTYQYALDRDEDGIEDDFDNCPMVPNQEQADRDQDTWGDECDNCPQVANETQQDTDGDLLGDVCDQDPDGDELTGEQDNCPQTANSQQLDSDDDGDGDLCDPDIDGDGFLNPDDNCPYVHNPDQVISDPSLCGRDQDSDGVPDYLDNCPTVPNPEQINSDDDPLGDSCDWDKDNDRLANDQDSCPTAYSRVPKDMDGDGIHDACDDHICFVTDTPEVCIDLEGEFMVYAGADRTVEVDECVPLFIWSNGLCEGSSTYTWMILSQPAGSTVELRDESGDLWYTVHGRWHYAGGMSPTITPDSPGDYRLLLEGHPGQMGHCPTFELLTDEIVITAR